MIVVFKVKDMFSKNILLDESCIDNAIRYIRNYYSSFTLIYFFMKHRYFAFFKNL